MLGDDKMTLSDFFKENTNVALAFSGGVDSAYLLYAAIHGGAEVRAYYVKSAFQPQFEFDDAVRLANELNADLKIINIDVLSVSEIVANPLDRCYHCKKYIFSAIADVATRDGKTLLIDGTNASDSVDDRPGMKALKELNIRSPLRECGLTKDKIRSLSKEAGLFTWNKPAYACLATRIPAGEKITAKKLAITERAEDYLFSLGFTDFRVRMNVSAAKIQLPSSQHKRLIENREQIIKELKQYYSEVVLDLEARNE